MMPTTLLATVADPRPVALHLFRDPIFNLAMLVIALMAMAVLFFWLLDGLRTLVWRLRERPADSGPAAPAQSPTDGVHIEEPHTDLRRRFFHRVRLLPRALSEGRMNEPPWRK
jgi:hypothetical protein